MNSRYRMLNARGFGMVEVLVALVILSVGLLGLAALQGIGIQFNTTSYARTQATIAAYDLMDRMRANPAGMAISPNPYHVPDVTAAAAKISAYQACKASTCNCASVSCDAATLALWDLGQWYELHRRLIPGSDPGANSRTTATINAASKVPLIVTLRWVEGEGRVNTSAIQTGDVERKEQTWHVYLE